MTKRIYTLIILFVVLLLIVAGVLMFFNNGQDKNLTSNKSNTGTLQKSENKSQDQQKIPENKEQPDQENPQEQDEEGSDSESEEANQNQEEQIRQIDLSERENEDTEIEENNSLYSQALENKDPDKCLEKEDTESANTCLKNLAYHLENKEICNLIEVEDTKNRCLDYYFLKQANSASDLEICTNIKKESRKGSCVVKIMRNNQNISQEDCEVFTEDFKESCEKTISFHQAENSEDCEKIEDEAMRQECLSQY